MRTRPCITTPGGRSGGYRRWKMNSKRVIENEEVIRKILKHLELRDIKPKPPPRSVKSQLPLAKPCTLADAAPVRLARVHTCSCRRLALHFSISVSNSHRHYFSRPFVCRRNKQPPFYLFLPEREKLIILIDILTFKWLSIIFVSCLLNELGVQKIIYLNRVSSIG